MVPEFVRKISSCAALAHKVERVCGRLFACVSCFIGAGDPNAALYDKKKQHWDTRLGRGAACRGSNPAAGLGTGTCNRAHAGRPDTACGLGNGTSLGGWDRCVGIWLWLYSQEIACW